MNGDSPVARFRSAVSAGATFIATTVVALACTTGSVTDNSGPGAPTDTTGGGGGGPVQRGTLTVNITVHPDDAAVAAQVGMTVAGLTVRLTRQASADSTRSAETDAAGAVRFDGLLEGVYTVATDRPLSAAEIAALPAGDRDVSVFAGAAVAIVRPPSRHAEISLVASRRGSLIISEFFFLNSQAVGHSSAGHYIEVYNNADTSVALDGVLLFRTFGALHIGWSGWPCDNPNASLRTDPTGVWANLIYRFPGSGRDYVLQPGQAAVMATTAIDHRPTHPLLHDLRAAQFEVIGSPADPDNPNAANMLRLTYYDGEPAAGEPLSHTMALYGLALPIASDTTQLDRATLDHPVRPHAISVFRIPRTAVLDVAALAPVPTLLWWIRAQEEGTQLCTPFTATVFDLLPAPLIDIGQPAAIGRKSLGIAASGIEILQRTRTSERDFEYAPPLQRSLQRPP